MPKVKVGDVELFYTEVGEGPPLVLIMGFGGDHLAWAFQVPAFAERYRVIAFDNRGAGQSDQPDQPYTIRTMAEDTVGLMDRLGIERAHVLGVSMGGMIAQELALNHPDRVTSLQLHCTLARLDRYFHERITASQTVRQALPLEGALRTLFLWMFAPSTYNERPEFVEMFIKTAIENPYPQTITGFVRQGEAIATHDTLDRLSAIRCPTLVSVAAEDILIPPRYARQLADGIPGARYEVLEGAGHVYFWEQPEGFNRLCLDFLASVR